MIVQMTEKQAHVLDNLERIAPLPYKLNVKSRVTRYQLDGEECTAQITGLVVRKLVLKGPDGRLRRGDPADARPIRRRVERQPHSAAAVSSLRASLLAPVGLPQHKIAPQSIGR